MLLRAQQPGEEGASGLLLGLLASHGAAAGSQPWPLRLESLGAEGQAALREARLASLVHYVMSLDRRSGFWFNVFRQKPEYDKTNHEKSAVRATR